MKPTYKQQFNIFKKYLGIDNIISIRFSDVIDGNFQRYKDTACTTLARSLKNNISTYIDREEGQLCSGGNYFLGVDHPTTKEIHEVYIKNERVFKNNTPCRDFINILPKYPKIAKKRYILFTPLSQEKKKPDVVLFLSNPAQTGRIIGLSVYKKFSQPLLLPAISTCASIYAPIKSGKIHLNFIDYYDRYYQGMQNKKTLWKESELIISMQFKLFKEIIEHIPLSAHGSYKPKIRPQKIDSINLK